MFEVAELELNVDKGEYAARVRVLRTALLAAQRALVGTERAVVILVNGVEGSGKGEVVNLLNAWLDARYVATHAFDLETEEQRQRPRYWRYWMGLPARGQIGVVLGNWYSSPIVNRVLGETKHEQFDVEMTRVMSFERALSADSTVIVKFWLHISKNRQLKRFRKLLSEKDTRAHVTERDKELVKHYSDFIPVTEHAIQRTSTASAPWIVVDAAKWRHRNLAIGEALLTALRSVPIPDAPAVGILPSQPPDPSRQASGGILGAVDLSVTIPREVYDAELRSEQNILRTHAMEAKERGLSTIIVFEGWDAAGKGGAIRRLLPAIDARQCRVISVAAPTDEERAHHYLWRFWRHLPELGRFTIYDRSWYGRVLVERVEGFAGPQDWKRAYQEINDFEAQLIGHGIVLCKFWLHISQEEQLRRFKEREAIPWKQHKITPDDYRNRESAPAYYEAVSEMVERTSIHPAPWHLVPAEDKHVARLEVIRTVNAAVASGLKRLR